VQKVMVKKTQTKRDPVSGAGKMVLVKIDLKLILDRFN